MQYLDIEKLDIDVEERKDQLWSHIDERQNQIRYLHYRKEPSEISGAFTAPPGVNPFHVAATKVRKLASGGSKLIFIWPQKSPNHGQMPSLLVPVFRGLLIGLLMLDTLHLWPGEFMPNRLPSTLPPPPPPIRCNVIEPRWSDSSISIS